MSTKVIVTEYNPNWVRIFEELRSFVLPVLSDLIVTIEHVGSTSVPGLAAKPIVDMDVVVPTRRDVQLAIQRLATLGYVHEGDLGTPGREAFIPPDGVIWHHLYVCTLNNAEYKRHIAFRDYLRKHPNAAVEYGRLKIELAQRFHHDRSAYSKGKSEFVEGILAISGSYE
ncbi:GrpB family protein [Paenibacillus planticolens]|uniref:GrpB family protein n=1 Tax=Paenibacillus planticolens TaxID=2654976 RepID=A0ABX1ZLW9_9BACL|nr:GrpB family protein [Paenibacillus planticolens]NOV01062.1 GrpB family protein [Paenibacillus planticolens]